MATDAKKMANDCNKAWNSHDVNKILEFYTDDCVFEDLGTGSVCHGKKEFTDYINNLFTDLPDVKWEVKSAFGNDDWAGIEWIFAGTQTHTIKAMPVLPVTGKTFSLRIVGIHQLRKGKYTRETVYANMVTFMQQLGLMPGQPK